ncbi:MAG: insulinase family protein [Clostridia bacterium]|nr:insulinase family protein [Clostridia bacterium]
MSAKITQLSNGVEGVFIKNDRFNTTLISFNFYVPMSRDTAAEYALLPFVMTTCSKDYPDFSRLNFKLAKLYGANLSASAEKVGDYQLLKIAISTIDDRFALDNESLCDNAIELLGQLIFEPKVQDGAFCEEDVEREKRKAIEHIRGDLAQKRIYAKKRLIEEMYKDEAYGVPKCGTEEQVQKITGESLYNAWVKLLSTAFLRVNVISRSMPTGLFDGIAEKFSSINRYDIPDCTQSAPTAAIKKPNTVIEEMDIAQGKLCMGFSSELYGDDELAAALTVMCDIFGGGPYSRLFTNVREKMSLCYYCASGSVKSKGLITVDSGVEKENANKAEREILNQLDIIKQNLFTDEEFESSIKSITDSFKSYNDSQGLLDAWYSLKIVKDKLLSPEEAAELILGVTRNDVVYTARGVKLHTVYKLLPKEKEGK